MAHEDAKCVQIPQARVQRQVLLRATGLVKFLCPLSCPSWRADGGPMAKKIHRLHGSQNFTAFHKEKSSKMQQLIKIYYSIFIWSSTCFGRHTAHHQEPKTALVASGYAYVKGCWTCGCWTLSASSNYTSNNLPRMQNQRLLGAVLGSWWWAVCRPKHVEPLISME